MSANSDVVITNPVTEKYYRLSQYEFQLLRSLDGTQSIEQACEKLKMMGRYYSQEDARRILERASQLGLILGASPVNSLGLVSGHTSIEGGQRIGRLLNVFFVYVPLVNPDTFLDRTLWIFKLLCNKTTFIAFSCLTLTALHLLLAAFPRIVSESTGFLDDINLVSLWLVVVLIRITHEFSHAYTAKMLGLHVRTMGVAFLLFIPCPYCDTTEAWKLSSGRQRILISSAGVLAEFVLGVLSVFLWYFSKPGALHSLAFYVMVISTTSTILFNGNPLLRFDGYFVLMDYLRMPNLYANAKAYIKYLFMNRLLGIPSVRSIAVFPKQRVILGLYGAASLLYRCFLYVAIVVGLYIRFDKMVGVLLATWALLLFVVRPLMRGISELWKKRSEMILHLPRSAVMTGIALGLSWVVLLWPWSDKSVFPCVMESVSVQKITVPLDAPIEAVLIQDGMTLREGALLFQLEPSALEFVLEKAHMERDLLKNTLSLLALEQSSLPGMPEKRSEVNKVEEAVRHIERDLSLARTGIRAPFDCIVTGLDPRFQAGFQPGSGVVVGELRSKADCVVHALIPGASMHEVGEGQEVTIWFPIRGGETFVKKIDKLMNFSELSVDTSTFPTSIHKEIATELKKKLGSAETDQEHFLCTIRFPENALVPLGMSGKVVVASTPRSVLERLVTATIQTFNRESLL